jgi:hypothetical protein
MSKGSRAAGIYYGRPDLACPGQAEIPADRINHFDSGGLA